MGVMMTTDAILAAVRVVKNAMGIIMATGMALAAVKVVMEHAIAGTVTVLAVIQMAPKTIHTGIVIGESVMALHTGEGMTAAMSVAQQITL